MTAGVFMENDTEWTSASYSLSTATFDRYQRLTARRQLHLPIGSYDGARTRTWASAGTGKTPSRSSGRGSNSPQRGMDPPPSQTVRSNNAWHVIMSMAPVSSPHRRRTIPQQRARAAPRPTVQIPTATSKAASLQGTTSGRSAGGRTIPASHGTARIPRVSTACYKRARQVLVDHELRPPSQCVIQLPSYEHPHGPRAGTAMAWMIARPTASATGGGSALPICL